ncbi:uncharacterized protein BJ212DRAFT_1361422 [Suillus subaureus]|uniref:BTB domain-containing protein n=1 Tax=Suillus subaureus TaxID=48587 RepID=A0A9P7JCL5_9AGAM|nr:uncharacterized protein BJ212DRAFT_1361422 [Suillus subaureus]KAG1814689.1 hypothetical protein BJ212DRAFT_1361422 [Suillus subaureus]
MAHGSQNGVSPMHHHPEYYLKDGDITFHVQGTLFCVHRHFFERESQFFAKEFAKAPKEGTSDSTAFRLDRVNATDFANFLWVWYSPSYRRESKPKDHWLTILELSTIWQFPEMKKLAVDELQNLEIEPIEKITTYDRYNIDKSLLLPAYKLLVARLKMPTILGIHEARERAIRSAAESGCRSPTSADAGDEELDKILIDVFNLESRATNRQGAQSQAKSDPAPTLKPDLNGTTNGNRSPPSGSVSKRLSLETVCCGAD